MRAVLAFLIVFLGLSLSSEWYPDFKKGVEVAKREGKLVMIYFYEVGCTYCKYMEEVVFIEPEIADLMDKGFVVVPIDVDEIPEDLDRRFRAVGTPSFLFYDPMRDKVIFQIFGMHEADEFAKLLKQACSKAKVRSC